MITAKSIGQQVIFNSYNGWGKITAKVISTFRHAAKIEYRLSGRPETITALVPKNRLEIIS